MKQAIPPQRKFKLRYGYKKPGYGYYTKTGMYLQRLRFITLPYTYGSYQQAWDAIPQVWDTIPYAKQFEVVETTTK